MSMNSLCGVCKKNIKGVQQIFSCIICSELVCDTCGDKDYRICLDCDTSKEATDHKNELDKDKKCVLSDKDKLIEKVCRELCRIRGLDPDAQPYDYPHSHSYYYEWAKLSEEVTSYLEIQEAINNAGIWYLR